MTDELARHRSVKLKEWVNLAHSLDSEEALLKEAMNQNVLMIVKYLQMQYQYPEMGIVAEMKSGVQLTGRRTLSVCSNLVFAQWPARRCVETCSFRELVLKATVSQGDLDEIVMQKTLSERDRGWLVGPLKYDCLPPARVGYPRSRCSAASKPGAGHTDRRF